MLVITNYLPISVPHNSQWSPLYKPYSKLLLVVTVCTSLTLPEKNSKKMVLTHIKVSNALSNWLISDKIFSYRKELIMMISPEFYINKYKKIM